MTGFCFDDGLDGEVGLLYRHAGGGYRLGWVILMIILCFEDLSTEEVEWLPVFDRFFLPLDLVLRCLSMITSNSSI